MPGKDSETQGPRLIPKVTFGLGAAILAGVVVVSVAPSASAGAAGAERVVTTGALSGAINAAGGVGMAGAQTTCCGDKH